jgi:hypothetical protein
VARLKGGLSLAADQRIVAACQVALASRRGAGDDRVAGEGKSEPMNELPSYRELPPAARGGRSAWGLFGPDDNIGLVNLLTPERLVRSGG